MLSRCAIGRVIYTSSIKNEGIRFGRGIDAQHRVAPVPPPVFVVELIGWRRPPAERDR